jgi:rubrerythrin
MNWNSPLGVLRRAMQIERNGYRFYTDAASRSVGEKGQRMFLGLAEDERRHLHLLLVEYDALDSGKGWVDPTKALDQHMEFDPANPDLPGEDYPEPLPIFTAARQPSLENDKAALTFALETEQMSYDLYRNAAEEQDDAAAKRAYGILAAEENKHYVLLQSSRDYLESNETWWDSEELPFFEG